MQDLLLHDRFVELGRVDGGSEERGRYVDDLGSVEGQTDLGGDATLVSGKTETGGGGGGMYSDWSGKVSGY